MCCLCLQDIFKTKACCVCRALAPLQDPSVPAMFEVALQLLPEGPTAKVLDCNKVGPTVQEGRARPGLSPHNAGLSPHNAGLSPGAALGGQGAQSPELQSLAELLASWQCRTMSQRVSKHAAVYPTPLQLAASPYPTLPTHFCGSASHSTGLHFGCHNSHKLNTKV